MAIVALKLYNKTAGDKIIIARNVSKKIKANPTLFTNLPLLLKDFDTHILEAEEAQADTIHGGETETEIRDEKMGVVESDLKTLGLYVNQISQGNAAVIRKAGMPIKKQRGAIANSIEAPKFLQVKSTVSGQASLVWDKVVGSRSYSVEYCDNIATPVWSLVAFNTKNKATVKNLQNKDYWFRVCAVGVNSLQSPFTQAVKVTVQS